MYGCTFENESVVGAVCALLVLTSFGNFYLARAYTYSLCVSGAVNTQHFVWKVFTRYI